MKRLPFKKIILFSIFLGGISSYALSQPAKKLIDKHFEALMKHDVKAIAEDYADDAKVTSPNWEGEKTGSAGVNEIYSRYFSSTPDLFYKVNNIIYAGDNVIVEYDSGGTLSNPENGTPDYMKGKKYRIKYCAIFTLKSGKIIKEADYFDQVAFLRQVGFFDPHYGRLQIFTGRALIFI